MPSAKSNAEYDLAIIGGGITGAAIARDASLRGLSVILCEKGDFGGGASSKSSKLIHGGLRYLEQFNFSLVKEALEERSILIRTAPQYVKWLPFIFPVYKNQKRPFWMIKLGLQLYELFSHHAAPHYVKKTREEIVASFPGLNAEGLKGGCLYYDAQMDDSRLVIANLLSAKQKGAHLYNYTAAAPLIGADGKVQGITYGDGKVALAKQVIDASGAWSNTLQKEIPLSPTKGVHLVIPRVSPQIALTLEAPQDQRIIFLLPWNGSTLLGTTETPFQGYLDAVSVEEQDIAYLLNAYNHYFPEHSLSPSDVRASFAGVRPLIKDIHNNPFKISRKSTLHRSANGLMSIIGGKYTIYRKMAQEAVDQLTDSACTTDTVPLMESSEPQEALLRIARELGVDQKTFEHLLQRYGSATLKILQLIEANPEGKKRICPHHPFIQAEFDYAIEEEFVVQAEDWLTRRTSIVYHPVAGCSCAQAIQEVLNQRKTNASIIPSRSFNNLS